MELKIKLHERELDFEVGALKGSGLDNLIKNLGKIKFDTILLEGTSKSYTFQRQVALLINLLLETKKAKLILKSGSFRKQGRLVIPLYQ